MISVPNRLGRIDLARAGEDRLEALGARQQAAAPVLLRAPAGAGSSRR